MPRNKTQSKPASSWPVDSTESARGRVYAQQTAPPTVSARWLLLAVGGSIVAAAACAWGVLWLLFWQGSWQLLYHPSSTVARTPASAGLAFDAVSFAATEAGETRLKGWWIPAGAGARQHRYTVLYLHGQDGNLGDSVDELAALHAAGANVLAFDYRGYGQSLFEHPSEARWRQDATWALAYLTDARQIAATSIVLYGKGLGANLALELAAEHPELAGVVVESPLDDPLRAVFGDPRARMVPARLLVQDRYDTTAATKRLRTPSLWLIATATPDQAAGRHPEGYDQVAAPKSLVRLAPMPDASQQWSSVLSVWLDELPSRSGIH